MFHNSMVSELLQNHLSIVEYQAKDTAEAPEKNPLIARSGEV